MTRTGYPSDVTDAEWALIEPLLPPSKSEINLKWGAAVKGQLSYEPSTTLFDLQRYSIRLSYWVCLAIPAYLSVTRK